MSISRKERQLPDSEGPFAAASLFFLSLTYLLNLNLN